MARTNMETDHAEVAAPPPFLFLATVTLGFLLDYMYPLPLPASVFLSIAAAVLCTVAISLLIAGIISLRRANTTINPYKPTSALTTSGIYRHSRNPLYLSLAILQIGLGLLARNAWMVVFAGPLAVLLRVLVIEREERYLEKKFGSEYLEYKEKVPRWI